MTAVHHTSPAVFVFIMYCSSAGWWQSGKEPRGSGMNGLHQSRRSQTTAVIIVVLVAAAAAGCSAP